jgi:pullulanase
MQERNFCAAKGHENSFNAGDSINAIDWSLKTKNKDVFEYVKALIKMRKEHPAFRMTTAKEIAAHLLFEEKLTAGVVGYTINGEAVKDSWKKIRVYFNGAEASQIIKLDLNHYKIAISNNKITSGTAGNTIKLQSHSCTILYTQ